MTYLHGLIYLEQSESGSKWVFESLKHCFQAKDYPNLSKTIGELYANSIFEYEEQQKKLDNAKDKLR